MEFDKTMAMLSPRDSAHLVRDIGIEMARIGVLYDSTGMPKEAIVSRELLRNDTLTEGSYIDALLQTRQALSLMSSHSAKAIIDIQMNEEAASVNE